MIKNITLGSTGITTPVNGFGALPIQRISKSDAVYLLKKAYDGGMTFFDTARAYTDSEEKVGCALSDIRDKVTIATKSMAYDPSKMRADLETSLSLLKTDYVDIFQPHCVPQCFKPGDGTGVYEELLKLKSEGKIKHIGITTHKIEVAFEIVNSGLYETLQYPFSYLSSDREIELVKLCEEKNMGFIGMKALAGGLINNSRAAMAFMLQFNNVIPIWGMQKESELDEFLSYMDNPPAMDDEITAFISKEKAELDGEFCRGCGYCMPCPQGIQINNCARISLMLRRAPNESWLSESFQAEMKKIETCLDCNACKSKCPYSLDTPNLLRKNYEYYKEVLAAR